MKKIIALIAVCFCVFSVFAQNAPLKKKQKVKDFNYLYKVLEENYPYFGVNQRQNNVNWLSNKKEYTKRIENTQTDTTYIAALQSIIEELKDRHLDFFPTIQYNYFKNTHNELAERIQEQYPDFRTMDPQFAHNLDVLNNALVRADYWNSVLKLDGKFTMNETGTKNVNTNLPKISNYSDSILSDNKIAIMRFRSFEPGFIQQDYAAINTFISKLHDVEYLIIDIQGNTGGNDSYWRKNIVSRLIKDTVKFTAYSVIKDGALNRECFPSFFTQGELLKKNDRLQNIPQELLNNRYYINGETDVISPDNSGSFTGKIYLLTDGKVFSAAEGFAYFCKSSGWATVAGERTAGDGGSRNPVIFMLPESGILIRAPFNAALNPDGSLNAETRTVPDIEITGENVDERLNKLVKLLTE